MRSASVINETSVLPVLYNYCDLSEQQGVHASQVTQCTSSVTVGCSQANCLSEEEQQQHEIDQIDEMIDFCYI